MEKNNILKGLTGIVLGVSTLLTSGCVTTFPKGDDYSIVLIYKGNPRRQSSRSYRNPTFTNPTANQNFHSPYYHPRRHNRTR